MIPGGFTASAEYRVEYTYANGVTHTCQSTSGNGPDGSTRMPAHDGPLRDYREQRDQRVLPSMRVGQFSDQIG